MRKIKDNVELKELEKFGFYKIDTNLYRRQSTYSEKDKLALSKDYIVVFRNRVLGFASIEGPINEYECDIDMPRLCLKHNRVKRYVEDLIKAGLVEKVE